jgi:CheY-like chemotaxis protein
LAFSRKQVLAPRILDLNQVLRESERILRRLIGEDVEFVSSYAPNLPSVKIDPGQIDQVVMNLAVNARDAMPKGGQLTVQTAVVEVDASNLAEHPELTPGSYVLLALSDTGIGMDRETQLRIFEPFFTTKGVGKGTGLGLSTVFGIVKQSGGSISVFSEPDNGTTFKLYLPSVQEQADDLTEDRQEPTTLQGTETLLVVEDQDEVRAVALEVLRRCGYHVLDARSGGEAILHCERFPRTIHLLLTDVVMPQMNGRELAERLAPMRPDMRVLYMSGYTDNAIVQDGILDPGIEYIQKPLVPDILARRIREVLDATPARYSRPSSG